MDIAMMNPLGCAAIKQAIVAKQHALGGATQTAPAGAIVEDNDPRGLVSTHLFTRGAKCGC
jgi:hypothetical protein